VLHEWAVPEGADVEDMAVVKAANPFSGITADMLAEKFASPTMTRHHWLRFVCNRPTRDNDAWLGEDGDLMWAALEVPYAFVPGAPTWVGVDVGIKRDSTAVVAVQRDEDGLHAVARFWLPTADQPVDVTDVMQHLRELAAQYDVQAVSFDPRFFDVPAKMLADAGLPMVEIPQSVERMTTICGSLMELIKRGEMHHDGDPMLRQHVLGAVPRFNDHGFTLQKSKSRGRIDGVIALALAADRAMRHETPSTEAFFAWA
jgi:phage terminase large subunit-like protein